MNEKVVGYVFLLAGLLVMAPSALAVYRVFSGASQPARLFATSGVSLDLGQIVAGALPPELVGQVARRPAEATEIVPAAVMNTLLNLFAHLAFMGFLMSFGFKLSSLGIQLIRPIKVTLKGEKETHG